VAAEFGEGTAPDAIAADRFAEWFGSQWARRAPSTWQRQGWLAADFTRILARRKLRPDRTRALSRAEIEALLTREDIGLRERTLWRMLYETAARSAEVLALDVPDLDLPTGALGCGARAAPSTSSSGRPAPPDSLPRLLKGRTSGLVFVTERKARVQLPAADLDELGRS
jgi:integrase